MDPDNYKAFLLLGPRAKLNYFRGDVPQSLLVLLQRRQPSYSI